MFKNEDRNRNEVLISIFMLLIIFVCTGCQSKTTPTSNQPEQPKGNSVGNVMNGSFIATQGDWVYYRNISVDNCIYKIKTDGTERQKISDDIYTISSNGVYRTGKSINGYSTQEEMERKSREEEVDNEDEEPEKNYTAVALVGCVILSQDDTLFSYQKKCEDCGTLQPGSSSKAYGGDGQIYKTGFTCVDCQSRQDVEIQTAID